MIVVRIYDKNFNLLHSLIFGKYAINVKYACLTALDKAYAFANARFGLGKSYQFCLYATADKTDWNFVKNV